MTGHQATFRDAVGELLAVARTELSSEQAAVPAARAAIARQLARVQAAWRAIGPSATAPGATVEGGEDGGLGTLGTSRFRPTLEGQGLPGGLSAEPGARPGRYPELERDLVTPRQDDAAETLAERLAAALGDISRGPAGVGRLTRPMAAAGGDAPTAGGRAPAHAGIGRAATGSRELARLAERGSLEQPVGLGGALAPEAMLGGLWSAVAADRPTRGGRAEVPGELTSLAFEPAAGETGDGSSAQGGRPALAGSARGVSPIAAEAGALRPGTGRRQAGAVSDGGRQLRLGRITRILERAGLHSDAAQDVLVDALARNVSRGRRLVAREHGALADFSWAWLGRVDGSRTGLDLELQSDREAFAQVFAGLRRGGAPAEAGLGLALRSPIEDAGFVVPRAPSTPGAAEDRSGVRRVARAAGLGRTSAARPTHRTAEAARQTNWRFVDTGSRASSAHADLGRLAATVLDAPDVGRRVPMPLVVPVVKAVAQSALREDASAPGANVDSAKQRANQQSDDAKSSADSSAGAKLSDEALDAMAHEFADRIARRMKREQERRGLCL
ncbi:MAG: hypothetical protein H6744_04475 [Deltaproteobacteria bacterium]|nr:hypothetical protein [Deltaproteobacteria bacterium]MCB9785930.1 hypothetical protein [Deltaproteobacteria bacterium]